MNQNFEIREAKSEEYKAIGKLMVNVYSKLEGFPKKNDQPEYYKMLANIGEWCKKPCTKLLVAVDSEGEVGGAVVYFSDMKYYGSGGTATQEENAAGFRLLAVDPKLRGNGLGTEITLACIDKAKNDGVGELIIHSTEYMRIAWNMYEKLGFKRSSDLDFMQEELPVFGFRLQL
ncbi:GNAT family N-acetyltransferase [Draconibacterium sp. IB214405]|uniref:GNAT family N-acetyltransferase n=1 Tax=Draconibacterium sp. IB214405 TaxID=3097352 RepID=UPI002A0F9C14|nr:GNAT family N-acetyltransferase [Draconibacterium sp. IB214405]MDX8340440.1 GNAT family N-acetyltransferase [Draconibacterium sp. IB214405]